MHPDPLVSDMDPRIQIRTKISWIRNTEGKTSAPHESMLPRYNFTLSPATCVQAEGARGTKRAGNPWISTPPWSPPALLSCRLV
jgi:hypothetical protein